MNNNLILVKLLGGSRSYGLENEHSDYDYRGVFLNTELRFVLGLDKHEHQEFTGGNDPESQDVKYKELRHFLNMLRQSNTEAMEMMFAEEFLEVTPVFKELQKHKYELLDTERAYKCLRGYMQGERRLANGDRTGQLGGKRKTAIDNYGFSPKNFVQLLRLAWAGKLLFEKGLFPVNVKTHDKEFAEYLLDVKNNPQNYSKEQLNFMVDKAEVDLENAFKNVKPEHNYKFNQNLANEFVLKAYYPLLTDYYNKLT